MVGVAVLAPEDDHPGASALSPGLQRYPPKQGPQMLVVGRRLHPNIFELRVLYPSHAPTHVLNEPLVSVFSKQLANLNP